MSAPVGRINPSVQRFAESAGLRRPPDPGICERCGRTRGYRPADEACCTWTGKYRGRHRKAARS